MLTTITLDADKVQSIYQGRPVRLRVADSEVPALFLDEYEELESFNSLTYSATPQQLETPTRSISTTSELCRLSVIAESIIATLYTESSSKKDARTLLEAYNAVTLDLERWHKSLPEHLNLQWHNLSGFDALPHSLSLMYVNHYTNSRLVANLESSAMYNALVILLSRPFLSEGHLQALSEEHAGLAFAACVTAATEIDAILRLYKTHFCLKTCPYFISYATYASGTIHARVAAQRPAGSHSHQMLRHCLEVLSEQQRECHAPRQSMRTLLVLSKRLGVDVGAGLRADRSRGEEIGDSNELEPNSDSTPQEHMASNVTDNDPWENTRFDADLEDIDMAAIIDSFVFDPSEQPGFDALGSGELSTVNCAETQYTSNCVMQDTIAPGMSEGVNFDDLLPANEGGTEDFFDSLFGFDAASS